MNQQQLPQFIAHRGASGNAPENTIEAIQLASAQGAKCIEIDVQLTKDNQPVVFHDHNLHRIFSKSGSIAEIEWNELQQLDAGIWFSQKFNCKVPHLRDVLIQAEQLQLVVNIELKPANDNDDQMAKIILDTINKTWEAKELPYITSYSRTVLQHVYAHHNSIPLGLIIDEPIEDYAEFLSSIASKLLIVNARLVTKQYIREIQRFTQDIYTYVVNDAKEAEKLFAIDVKGIFTNYIEKFHDN